MHKQRTFNRVQIPLQRGPLEHDSPRLGRLLRRLGFYKAEKDLQYSLPHGGWRALEVYSDADTQIVDILDPMGRLIFTVNLHPNNHALSNTRVHVSVGRHDPEHAICGGSGVDRSTGFMCVCRLQPRTS